MDSVLLIVALGAVAGALTTMQLSAVARNSLAPLPLEEVQQLAAVFDRVKAEYVEPVEFFRRTFLTEGLRDLLERGLRRINGDMNTSPVINLQTNFGGGKTHSMIALYHLASGVAAKDLPGVGEALAEALHHRLACHLGHMLAMQRDQAGRADHQLLAACLLGLRRATGPVRCRRS